MASFVVKVTLVFTHEKQLKSHEIGTRSLTGHWATDRIEEDKLTIYADYGSEGYLEIVNTQTDEGGRILTTKSHKFPFSLPSQESVATGKQQTITLQPRSGIYQQTTLKTRYRKKDVVFIAAVVGLGPHLEWFSAWQDFLAYKRLTGDLTEIKRKRETLQGAMLVLENQENAIRTKLLKFEY